MSETISLRVPEGTKDKLMVKVRRGNHADLTSYLRGVVLYAADADDDIEMNAACAPQTCKLDLRDDQGCPLLRFVATERCNACPYREQQPAVSREQLSLNPPPSGEDEISKIIGDLFKEDEGKT